MMKCNICSHYCRNNSLCGQTPLEDDENIIKSTGIAVDPMEKKPLYHFLPGSKTLSVGTLGCNFKCLNCQNHEIAQPVMNPYPFIKTVSPEQIVQNALKQNLKSISWTYNEASIHPKWIIKTAQLARNYDIKTVLVTNAYSSNETMKKLVKNVDAVNVDLKSMDETFYDKVCSGKLRPVLENIVQYYENDVHIEITNLLIPGYNDDINSIKNVINFIKGVSPSIVLHFSAFYPQFKLSHLKPTNQETIFKACSLAKKMGLSHVYPGNISPSPMDNTYCSDCGHILIEREGYSVKKYVETDGKCPECKKIVNL